MSLQQAQQDVGVEPVVVERGSGHGDASFEAGTKRLSDLERHTLVAAQAVCIVQDEVLAERLDSILGEDIGEEGDAWIGRRRLRLPTLVLSQAVLEFV